MEIPKAARKCPYCQHFQSRLSMVVLHPAFAVLFVCIPMLAFFSLFAKLFDRGEDYEEYKDQIVIAESNPTFGDSKNGRTVGVIGTIKNNSPIPWKDIRFHVEFFDADGRRIDAAQKEQYEFYLPPRESLSFKVSFAREYPETNYVKHSVRVVAAKDARVKW
jgi:hypothetical protein